MNAAYPIQAIFDGPRHPDPSLSAYRARGGYGAWVQVLERASPDALADLIESSGLVGKGGAGFPTFRKVRLMQAQSADHKVVVINGSEHEPGSNKDRLLLETYPHKVIEGAMILAHTVGADAIFFAINEGSARAAVRMRDALIELAADENLDVTGLSMSVQTVPELYLVGEETALLETLEGRKAWPRRKPPYPIQAGLRGVPTLVQNVETVASLPFIVATGSDAYRALGPSGTGSTLVTLGDEFTNPGVYEIPLGISIRDVLEIWGGGLRDESPIKCIQPGGPSSGFVVARDFDRPFDAATLGTLGSALGCAVIRAFSVDDCMVRHIGEVMHFFAVESCGQCPRCRMETNMLDTIVRKVLAGAATPALLDKVEGLIQLAKGQGICSLIDMPVAPIRTGLLHFRNEFTAHLEHRCLLCASDGHARDQALAFVGVTAS